MKLSIAVVTMNRAKQLENAISSCLACELPKETEFIIVDNASTDNTDEVVKSIFMNTNYSYTYEKQSLNLGAGAGRNRYFELASGEYVYGMDDDAVIDFKKDPQFFLRGIRILDDHPSIAALATQIYDEAWQSNRLEIKGKSFSKDLYYCKVFCEGSHFLRKSFFKEVPYLPNKYGYEGLPPSLKIWNEGYINAFCPSLVAIHQPKINKWIYSNSDNYDLLINECAVPYAIKKMMYPIAFRPFLLLAFKYRCIKYLKKVPNARARVNKAVKDIVSTYNVGYVIKLRTVLQLLEKFGLAIF